MNSGSGRGSGGYKRAGEGTREGRVGRGGGGRGGGISLHGTIDGGGEGKVVWGDGGGDPWLQLADSRLGEGAGFRAT